MKDIRDRKEENRHPVKYEDDPGRVMDPGVQKTFKKAFSAWLDGDIDFLHGIWDGASIPDSTREELKHWKKEKEALASQTGSGRKVVRAEQAGLKTAYNIIAVISCLLLIGVLLFTVANMPQYGEENPRAVTVARRYVEKGMKETGAVNIVAGMILDYRAFDTLGESHVLFTAFICVTILLRRDRKNMAGSLDDYRTIRSEAYFGTENDRLLRRIAIVLLPAVILFSFYVMFNGQLSPGGGFSGGAVLGAALILFTVAFGFETADLFFTPKVFMALTFASLAFYIFAKGYVFFTGANGLENHIPKGEPGAIFSGGLILPLDIAVGLVVACTMFGFYSLFKRGSIGRD